MNNAQDLADMFNEALGLGEPAVLQPEFKAFPKLARLNRNCCITEKLDGTNACVVVLDDGRVFAQSRTRLITPADDNFGFAAWVEQNAGALSELGPGHHFGEYYGRGIQRNYGLADRHFALFNTGRWSGARPACCGVVPVLYEGLFTTDAVVMATTKLKLFGSAAVPGFMRPEGVVVYHEAAGRSFKVTLENDELPKGKVE